MSEELREAVSDILARGVTYSDGFGEVNVADARAFVGNVTEHILAVLRPHLGPGVTLTEEQHRLIWAAASAVCIQQGGSVTETGRQLLDAIEAFNRLAPAIAGRGNDGR